MPFDFFWDKVIYMIFSSILLIVLHGHVPVRYAEGLGIFVAGLSICLLGSLIFLLLFLCCMLLFCYSLVLFFLSNIVPSFIEEGGGVINLTEYLYSLFIKFCCLLVFRYLSDQLAKVQIVNEVNKVICML